MNNLSFIESRGYFKGDDLVDVTKGIVAAYGEVCSRAAVMAQAAVINSGDEATVKSAIYWEAAARAMEQTISAMVLDESSPLDVLLDHGFRPNF